jgi:hypothetical protein
VKVTGAELGERRLPTPGYDGGLFKDDEVAPRFFMTDNVVMRRHGRRVAGRARGGHHL